MVKALQISFDDVLVKIPIGIIATVTDGTVEYFHEFWFLNFVKISVLKFLASFDINSL